LPLACDETQVLTAVQITMAIPDVQFGLMGLNMMSAENEESLLARTDEVSFT